MWTSHFLGSGATKTSDQIELSPGLCGSLTVREITARRLREENDPIVEWIGYQNVTLGVECNSIGKRHRIRIGIGDTCGERALAKNEIGLLNNVRRLGERGGEPQHTAV